MSPELEPEGTARPPFSAAQPDTPECLPEGTEIFIAYDSTTFAERLQTGDAWLAQGYSGELAKVARESGGTITYAVPREGCSLTTDNLVIPASAPHADLAHEFINFMLDPQVAAETTNATGYATANAGARPYIRPVLLNDPAVFPDPERLARCEPLLGLGDVTYTLGVAWEEIKKQ